MARPHDYSELPRHPSVGEHYRKQRKYGYTTVTADVTCPTCGLVRSFALYTLRQQMQRPNFTGQCRKCGHAASRKAATEALRRRYAGKKRIVSSGYVAISASAVAAEDIHLFEAMRGKGSFVFEHRLVVARHLGRPLTSSECVDHMDGNKTNNSLENLRIYVKGRNDPGSTCGHGTYYHEWQLALREIEILRKQLAH